MSPHATHPSWPYSDSCPDCAGYPVIPPSDDMAPTAGIVLQVAVWLVVIVALAVIVRLAVSR